MKNKYSRVKITVDNIEFDSKLESKQYLVLKKLEKEGIITDLTLQEPFVLIPKFECNGEKYRKTEYFADFTFKINDIKYVIDSKGMVLEVFKIKRKILAFTHKVNILIFYNDKDLEEWCRNVYINGYLPPPKKKKGKRK